jgi:putative thioredoxin
MAFLFESKRGKGETASTVDPVKDGDQRSFHVDVLEASMDVPVIVDFWATWCGPCKQVGPILEKQVRQANGAVRLVKIDVDRNPDLAAQLRVQSVPTVYAFVGGRPVDAFVGAQPESKIRAFIERLTRGARAPGDSALEKGQEALDSGDGEAAAAIFSQIIAQDPNNPKAVAGLIRSWLMTGNITAARRLVDGLSSGLLTQTDVAQAVAAIELAEEAQSAGDVAELQKRVAAHPGDHQSRFDLARALYSRGHVEGAIDALLALISIDRNWNDQAARKQLIKIFDALGAKHPATAAGRRRLSSILFS